MKLKLKTAPTTEPISLVTAKNFLRLESGTMDDVIDVNQSIAPGSHDTIADYGLTGSGVDIQGASAIVVLNAGACGSSGTVDVKIQESDDDSTYTDWSGGSFTQVTEANDNAVYEKEYTGTKQYVRAVATVGTAACEFAVTVEERSGLTTDDTLITTLVTAVRKHFEELTGRAFVTQTWYQYWDYFPCKNYLTLNKSPLQSVTSLKYTDSGDTENTFSTDYYSVDTSSDEGRIVLDYGESWPGDALATNNPIVAEFVAGHGDNASDVPEPIIQSMLVYIESNYYYRNQFAENGRLFELPFIDAFMETYRVARF